MSGAVCRRVVRVNEKSSCEEQPTILLVEADEHLGRVIAAYLERDGCRVMRVAGLPEAAGAATDELACHPVDLLILDLDHLDAGQTSVGIDVLASIPVVLLASGPVPPASARRRNAPVLLRKPFGMRELRRHVRSVLKPPVAVSG